MRVWLDAMALGTGGAVTIGGGGAELDPYGGVPIRVDQASGFFRVAKINQR